MSAADLSSLPPSHKEGTKWGYVFEHCTIDGNAAAADGRSKLGRPWHDRPVAVYLNSTMKIPLDPAGWTDMGPAAKLFAEYNSRDAGGRPVDLSRRRTWYKQSAGEGGQRIEGLQSVVTAAEAAKYTYQNVVEEADKWNPRALFVKPERPRGVKYSAGSLSWAAGGANTAGYIVYKDGGILGFTRQPAYRIDIKNKGIYRVAAVNPSGSFGQPSGAVWVK